MNSFYYFPKYFNIHWKQLARNNTQSNYFSLCEDFKSFLLRAVLTFIVDQNFYIRKIKRQKLEYKLNSGIFV